VLESFRDGFPGIRGELVYFISHNIVRHEPIDGRCSGVCIARVATRLFAGGSFAIDRQIRTHRAPDFLLRAPTRGSSVMGRGRGGTGRVSASTTVRATVSRTKGEEEFVTVER